MKVEIKERNLTAGNRSLYLEYYENGFRKKETLGLYLVPDDVPGAKKINAIAYSKARKIQADRILNPPSFDKKKPLSMAERAKTLTWLDWIDEYVEWSKDCNNCQKQIQHKELVRKRVEEYLLKKGKRKMLLKDVSKEEITSLFDYMRDEYRNPNQIKDNGGKLADFTLLLFEQTIKAMFNKALREDLIAFNPVHTLAKGERFHAPDKHREYLTPEELRAFLAVKTATENERMVQLAFGLSSMTGIRLGDIQHLRWENIQEIHGVKTICITQRKTKRELAVPLNDMALSLLPPREDNDPETLVFKLVKKSNNISKYVRRIKDKAGIEKDFIYHSSRHTMATLAVTAGVDISSVKAVLGYGSVTSTEVYAKVSLDKKIEAVSLFDGVF